MLPRQPHSARKKNENRIQILHTRAARSSKKKSLREATTELATSPHKTFIFLCILFRLRW